ncbi:hypothetical protein AX14_013295 [Amanita brunnescens Koide BX004]|nr:hypothetical protein AX14_013295 [Amanita brunnescens Koide BX004]
MKCSSRDCVAALGVCKHNIYSNYALPCPIQVLGNESNNQPELNNQERNAMQAQHAFASNTDTFNIHCQRAVLPVAAPSSAYAATRYPTSNSAVSRNSHYPCDLCL